LLGFFGGAFRMQWSRAFLPTLKEVPPMLRGGPEHWLLRAGLVASTSGGYAWLPLGMRMLRKLQDHLRRRLLQTGAQEIGLPVLTPVSLWQRLRLPEPEVPPGLRLDLAQAERKTQYLLGGGQEPLLAELASGWLASYRNLPLLVFQFGLAAGSEGASSSRLADAAIRPVVQVYGFHAGPDSLHPTYQQLLQQVENLLDFLELPYWVAQREVSPEYLGHRVVIRLSGEQTEKAGRPLSQPPPRSPISNGSEPSRPEASPGLADRPTEAASDRSEPAGTPLPAEADMFTPPAGRATETYPTGLPSEAGGFVPPLSRSSIGADLEEVAFCTECGYTAVRASARIGGRPIKPVPGALVLAGLTGPTPAPPPPGAGPSQMQLPGRPGQSGPTDSESPSAPPEPVRRVPTPGARTIAEVTAFLRRPPQQFLKTLLYLADGRPVAVLIRGDHQASEVKIRASFGISRLEMADPATVEKVTGAPVGFSGPVGLKEPTPLWADWDVRTAWNVVVGANEADAHLVGVCIGRDFRPDFFADLRMAMPADPCPQCPAVLQIGVGLSAAEAACLPTAQTEPLGLRFHDAQQELRPVRMHRLEVDLGRLIWAMAAVHHDQAGLVWPERFSPFDILLVCLDPEDEAVRRAAWELYQAWQSAGLEVLLDDRDLRPGVKFFDADLLGIPWRAVLGPKNYRQGQLELKHRRSGQKQLIPLADAAAILMEKVRASKGSTSE
jgi:prolyl-tRNA synthetase